MKEIGIIGHHHIGIPLAMHIAELNLHDTVVIAHDINYEEAKRSLQEQHEMKIRIESLPGFVPLQKSDYSRSKHHCNRKLKPRKNKQQAKSRRINRGKQ